MRPIRLKSVLKRTLKDLDLYDVYRRHRAVTFWSRVCGKEVSAVTRAQKLSGRILFVAVKDHIWASELSHFKYQYIKKFKKMLGAGVVEDIRFKADWNAFKAPGGKQKKEYSPEDTEVTKTDRKKIEKILSDVKDEKTRQLLFPLLAEKFKYERWLKKKGGEKCLACGVMIPTKKSFCPHCTDELEKKNLERLKETLAEKPWISYSKISNDIKPLSRDTFDRVKSDIAEKIYRNVIESMEKVRKGDEEEVSRIKGEIITLAMLRSGEKPAGLKNDLLKKVLPAGMYKFYVSK